MPEAVTTWRESLWIGSTSSSLSEVKWVVSSPEVGDPNSTVDATSFDNDRMTYIVGLKDYSGDLSWELNAQAYSNATGNLKTLEALDGQEVYLERRMPLVGVKVGFTGVATLVVSGASVNAIQKLTLRVTPTSAFTVSQLTTSGYAVVYKSSVYVGGVLVSLSPCTAQTTLYSGGSIGANVAARPLSYVSTKYGQTLSVPEGYTFRGWVDDQYGDGQLYLVGSTVRTVGGTKHLYPALEAD